MDCTAAMPAMMTRRLSTIARIGRRTKMPTQPPSSPVLPVVVESWVGVLMGRAPFPFGGNAQPRVVRSGAQHFDFLSRSKKPAALVDDLLSGLQRGVDEDPVAVARENGSVDTLDGAVGGE